MTTRITTHNLGFPRIGAKRELKRALESYWSGRTDAAALAETAKAIRAENWRTQHAAGIDKIPSNDFSLYDQMLDTACLVGAVPGRFGWQSGPVDMDTYFSMARGAASARACACACGHSGGPLRAMEMTKWFDTNYHYLVPELCENQAFALSATKPFDEFSEALALGIPTVPVLIGPLTFLKLSKCAGASFDRISLLPKLTEVYAQILNRLAALGANWVQLDEPALCLDLTARERAAVAQAFETLRKQVPALKILLAVYFGPLEDNLPLACELPVDALHVDMVRAPQELDRVLGLMTEDKSLSLGVVDGRNIWRGDFSAALPLLRGAVERLGAERVWVSASCSLLHVPVSLRHEDALDGELRPWLAFAEEKLDEVRALALQVLAPKPTDAFAENVAARALRANSKRVRNEAVRARVAGVRPEDLKRTVAFAQRKGLQQERLRLPFLPTTTIGSFPQTADVRSARARFKRGELSAAQYEAFLEEKTAQCVRWQEAAGIDVLVHGEFERNDMVEYFGEQLEGFAFTQNGWVQSYGSRCVKPPIVFGDVQRRHPMTVKWASYAQSLTPKIVKGMLTGPITILQWSFVRDDQPRRQTAQQIALALRDEVRDLEAAGIAVIQIDEPALREGLPLRREHWREYLGWATGAFALASSGVRPQTQIHTHMCYCEFDDILESIAALDADVISIEASRSNMELLDSFARFRYPNDIGLGVWDIHSPRVPPAEEMLGLILSAAKVIEAGQLWVNPDCGLKTRGWAEVEPALRNLVAAARAARASR